MAKQCEHRDAPAKGGKRCEASAVKEAFCLQHWWEACQRVAAWKRLKATA